MVVQIVSPAWWSSVVVQRGGTLCQIINGIVGLGLGFVAFISCDRQLIFLHSHYCFSCKGKIDVSGSSGSPFWLSSVVNQHSVRAWWSSVVVQRGGTLCQLINGIVGLGLGCVAYISCDCQFIFVHS